MRLLIAVARFVAQAVYAVIKAATRVRHKVVFLSRQSNAPSRDFLLLGDALRRRDPDLEIVMRCRMLPAGLAGRIRAAAAMIPQMYHLATSRACVVDGYVIPVSLLDHRDSLFVVQMWHALGAIKKFGYQAVGRPGGRDADLASSMRMHRNYDLVLCGGPATVPVFAEAFGVEPSIVEPLGLPRLDYLYAAAEALRAGSGPIPSGIEALRGAFPRLAQPGREVVLYAPTFRQGGADRYRDVAHALADERYTLVVKPHPLESARIEGENVVYAGGVDVLDLLPLCSAVITDYSAVAFEAAAIGVPVYFYVYDIDEFSLRHGLNIDPLAEMPQVSSRDVGELAQRIADGDTHPEATRRLREGYASAAPGCADRIAGRIIDSTRTS